MSTGDSEALAPYLEPLPLEAVGPLKAEGALGQSQTNVAGEGALGILAQAVELERFCHELDRIEEEFKRASNENKKKTDTLVAAAKARKASSETGLKEKTRREIEAAESNIKAIQSRQDKLVKSIAERISNAKRRVDLHDYEAKQLPTWLTPPPDSTRIAPSVILPLTWKEGETAGDSLIERELRMADWLDTEIDRRRSSLKSMKGAMGWVVWIGLLCFFIYLIPTVVMVGFLIVYVMHQVAIRDAITSLRRIERNLEKIGEKWTSSVVKRSAEEINAATQVMNEATQRVKALEDKGILLAAEEAERAEQEAFRELEEASRSLSEKRQSDIDKASRRAVAWSKEIRRKALELGNSLPAAPWADPIWNSWKPVLDSSQDMWLGTWVLDTPVFKKWHPKEDAISIPAVLPFLRSKPLLINPGGSREDALSIAKNLALRLLATHPPGTFQMTIVDPIAQGQNAAALLPLQEQDDRLVSGKAWSEARDIEAQLGVLQSHVETVIRRLSEDFATIAEFNQESEVHEPYKLLVVYDFPHEFSDVSMRRLQKLLRNGPRCGVQTILIRDPLKSLPHGHSETDFARHCFVIEGGRPGLRFEEAPMRQAELRPADSPSRERQSKILSVVGAASREGAKVEVPFFSVMGKAKVSEGGWGSTSTAKCLDIPLGPSGAGTMQSLTMGRGMEHHALIVGQTGSGKTNLMHVIICSLALKYSPEELELYLVDFKKGLGFKPYANAALPHARVIAIESEREFGLSVLEGLVAEDARRAKLFLSAGVDSFDEYREKTGERLPRVVMLVDEFQEFFREEDGIGSRAANLMDFLAKQARSQGIHMILGTQTLAGVANGLRPSTRGQMAIRIALPCNPQDSILILNDKNAEAAKLTRPGEAIYNNKTGAIEANVKFQVALFEHSDMEEVLRRVSSQAPRGHRELLVFEGHAPASLTSFAPIQALLEKPGSSEARSDVRGWLGEPVGMSDPISAVFKRGGGNNLLLAGKDEELTAGALLGVWISVAAALGRHGRHTLINGYDESRREHGLFEAMAWALGGSCERVDPNRPAEALSSLVGEIEERRKRPTEAWPRRFVLVTGGQRVRALRAPDLGVRPAVGEPDPALASRLLHTLASEGPEVGVHLLLACDSVQALERMSARALMREFSLRALGPMNEADSTKLTNSRAAAGLDRPYRMVFYNDNRAGVYEKFKTFELPEEAWLSSLAGSIPTEVSV